MCLIAKQRGWKRAPHDLVCYKVLKRGSLLDPWTYETPFQNHPIPEDILCGRHYLRAWGFAMFVKQDWEDYEGKIHKDIYIINGGAIHAFSLESDAWRLYSRDKRYAIFKCIIPKGTRYTVGIDDDICAKKMKFIRQII